MNGSFLLYMYVSALRSGACPYGRFYPAMCDVKPTMSVMVTIDKSVEVDTMRALSFSSQPNLIANIVVSAAVGALAATMTDVSTMPLIPIPYRTPSKISGPAISLIR